MSNKRRAASLDSSSAMLPVDAGASRTSRSGTVAAMPNSCRSDDATAGLLGWPAGHRTNAARAQAEIARAAPAVPIPTHPAGSHLFGPLTKAQNAGLTTARTSPGNLRCPWVLPAT
jgi:hypothetical protein